MRLFVAIPIPSPTDRLIQDTLHALRGDHWPVRWVSDQNLHLTLKFFGEVMPDRLETIAEMLEFAVERMTPLPISITGARAFPTMRHARVLRLEIDADPSLELLQDRIERGGERIGFPPEGRPFNPHVTLGRVREGHRLPEHADERLAEISPMPTVMATRIVLFESELTPAGPSYTARHELVLG